MRENNLPNLDTTSSQSDGNNTNKWARSQDSLFFNISFKYGGKGREAKVSEWILSRASSWRTTIASSVLTPGNELSPVNQTIFIEDPLFWGLRWKKKQYKANDEVPKAFSSFKNWFSITSHLFIRIMIETLLTSNLEGGQLPTDVQLQPVVSRLDYQKICSINKHAHV